MARVAEGLARVAGDIAASRLARSKLAAEIKGETNDRRNGIESFLKNRNSARGKLAQEQADDGRRAAKARNAEVSSLLLGARTALREVGVQQAAEAAKLIQSLRSEAQELRSETLSTIDSFKAARLRADRESRAEAVETNSRRQGEVKALLGEFAGERDVSLRRRRELAAEQHNEAAAFMRDLTNAVDAFRDKLAREGRDRAAEIRNSLSAYAQDRAEGMAIWRGDVQKSRVVVETPVPAEAPAKQAEPEPEPEAAPSPPVSIQRVESEEVVPEAVASESIGVHSAEADPEAADEEARPEKGKGRHGSRNSGHGRRGGHAE